MSPWCTSLETYRQILFHRILCILPEYEHVLYSMNHDSKSNAFRASALLRYSSPVFFKRNVIRWLFTEFLIWVFLFGWVFLFFELFWFFFFFLRLHPRHMKVPRLRVELEPLLQPQQLRIPAPSVTYTAAHGNKGSPTHWARPGIEPASLEILVGFVSAAPQWELPNVRLGWPSITSIFFYNY